MSLFSAREETPVANMLSPLISQLIQGCEKPLYGKKTQGTEGLFELMEKGRTTMWNLKQQFQTANRHIFRSYVFTIRNN